MPEFLKLLIDLISILLLAKIFSEGASKFGQSAILGELLAGVVLGPSVLSIVHETSILTNISEIGAIILLFEVGLSTNIYDFLKAGGWATAVAIVGVVIPYFLGYLVFIYFGFTNIQAIFAGAILTATSVGITARIFMDLDYLKTEESKIVLGAAVIDDIIGLILLGIVLRLIHGDLITFKTVTSISGSAILFLIITIIFGKMMSQKIFNIFQKMKQPYIILIISLIFCFVISALSIKVELAPIIGAFVGGLILSTIKQCEEIKTDIKPLYAFFVPIFFVLIGTNVDINAFNPFVNENKSSFFLIFILFLVAFIGKTASGFVIFKKGINKILIGISMVPRGEVGLIFLSLGLKNNIFSIKEYSTLIVVIILTTFITPVILKYVILKQKNC
ncbi:MAG: cation:proton antiporter [Endomicrobium sp.]|nr:cation:proton antiporter [Endomicrobium sp.]